MAGDPGSTSASASSSSVGVTYACPWPGCKKTYKRQDHCERHQKTHSGELNYRCEFCGKLYSRSDVLNRHLVQTHGQKAARAGRPRRAACMACVDEHVACDGAPPKICSRCRTLARPCRYRHLEIEAKSASPPRRPSLSPTATLPPLHPHQTFTSPPTSNVPISHYEGMEVEGFPMQQSPLASAMGLTALGDAAAAAARYESGRVVSASPMGMQSQLPWSADQQSGTNSDPIGPVPWLTDFLLSATITEPPNATNGGGNGLNFLGGLGGVTSVPPIDWGFSDLDANIFAPIGTHGPPTPSGVGSLPDPAREEDVLVAVQPEEVDGQSNVQKMPDGQPRESDWPNVYRPQTPDADLRLPATTRARGADLVPGRGIKPAQRTMMETLTMHAHGAWWSSPDLGNFPSEVALTDCVNLYLSHFAQWLPILDSPRGTFNIDKAAPVVLKAMAAVGSAYARDGLERLGLPLAELVRRELVFIRFMYELGVVQSMLLQGYYGLFSGLPKLFHHAEVARGQLVSSCKRMHLLDAGVSALEHLQQRGAGQEELERALKQDHRCQRLGWGIYLYDSMLACLFGQAALYPFAEIDAPLPTFAPDPHAVNVPFAQTMASLLDKGTLPPQSVDDIGFSVVAYTLYRLCLEGSSLQSFSRPHENTHKYTLRVPQYEIHPQALLDQLARHTLKSSSAPTHLMVSCAALAYHSHLQFTQTGLLDQIKIAAGRSGSAAAQAEAREAVGQWMHSHPAATRNVFANAALLGCLMRRFNFDTPPELVWILDAALCMWACLRFSPLNSPGTHTGSVAVAWSGSAALDSWVETGNAELTVQGLGAVPGLSTVTVLRSAADRLEVMSWGLAARYRDVLLGLCAEEAAGG